MSSETFQENSYVRVSNYTRNLDGGYIRFHQPLGIQKRIAKEKWVVVGKVIYNRRNYSKIEIIENQDGQKELDAGSFFGKLRNYNCFQAIENIIFMEKEMESNEHFPY